MRRHWIIGCAALLCSAPLLAHPGHQARMDELDTDKDGSVSLPEAQAKSPRLTEMFQDIDENKDGLLSRDELKAMHGKKFEKRVNLAEKFTEADKDGDSRLSTTEAAGVPFLSEHFADADKDGDGFVTQEELKGVKIKRVHRYHGDSHGEKPTTSN
jgi:hypothetical protein